MRVCSLSSRVVSASSTENCVQCSSCDSGCNLWARASAFCVDRLHTFLTSAVRSGGVCGRSKQATTKKEYTHAHTAAAARRRAACAAAPQIPSSAGRAATPAAPRRRPSRRVSAGWRSRCAAWTPRRRARAAGARGSRQSVRGRVFGAFVGFGGGGAPQALQAATTLSPPSQIHRAVAAARTGLWTCAFVSA